MVRSTAVRQAVRQHEHWRTASLVEPAGEGPLLAALAHELRAPLANFEATLEMLEAELPLTGESEATETLITGLARLRGSSRWLAAVVGNLATLAAVERGGPSPTPPTTLDLLAAVVEPALALIQPIAARRGQRLRLLCPDPLVRVRGEAQMLAQALLNLLTNASTHSLTGDLIDVSIRVTNDWVRIRVTDRGPGVPVAERERIFERYVRGASAGGPGLGLGLYLVRTIAERHGGTAGVDSAPDGGAAFWIELPALPTGGPSDDIAH